MDLIELELGSRDPEKIESLLREKPPLEAMRIIERINAEACGKYKTSIRVDRRTLDSWDTMMLVAGTAAAVLVAIAIILTAFSARTAAIVIEILALIGGAGSAYLMLRTKRLRLEIDRSITIQNEHCQDAAQLSLLSGALTGTGIEESQRLITRLLFTEEI